MMAYPKDVQDPKRLDREDLESLLSNAETIRRCALAELDNRNPHTWLSRLEFINLARECLKICTNGGSERAFDEWNELMEQRRQPLLGSN